MRLIDADELLKRIEAQGKYISAWGVRHIIREAPEVSEDVAREYYKQLKEQVSNN